MAAKLSFNPYTVLGLEKNCTEKEIQKAYKIQCLKWHPDKNLDNKEVAETKFIQAKEAFEFLYDKQQREEYDRGVEKIRVRDERQRERMEKADSTRKRFIDELNQREREFAERSSKSELTPAQEAAKRKQNEKRIKADFEELRRRLEKEADDELHAKHEKVREALRTGKEIETRVPDETSKLRLKWTCSEADDWNETSLRTLFAKYGKILEVSSIVPIKRGKMKMCVVEFAAGEQASNAELETGPNSNIIADWLIKPAIVDTKPTEELEPKTSEGDKFATMSFEELQEHLFADMAPPPEKREKKWHEE